MPEEVVGHADQTIGGWLSEVAADPVRRLATLTVEDDTADVADLDDAARAVAAGLLAHGLAAGDRVAVLAPACLDAVRAWFGIARAGLVEVPLNPASGTTALGWCLRRSRARAVVCDPALVGHLAEALERAADEQSDEPVGPATYAVEIVLVLGADPVPADLRLPPGLSVQRFDDLRATGSGEVGELPAVDPRDPAVILYTSGTTGPPKGVLLSHRANVNLARHTAGLMGYTPEDRLYSVFPLYHSNARYCSVMAGLEAGARVLLHRRFSASGFWRTCADEGVTAFNYQGAMISILHKQPPGPADRDHRVRAAFGAPCPAEIFEDVEERFGIRLTEIYGSTEVSLVCEMPPEQRRIGTAGRESPIYHVQVVDEHGRRQPVGVVGEIVARPKEAGWMFDGYDGDAAATAGAWRDLWFHTGDRGVLDQDGFLTFVDRVKDTVRRRGENVSTWEVERVLADHPSVAQVAAFGVPSQLSEEDVMVAVVPAGDPADPRAVDAELLLEHCRGRLTSFAVPRYVRFVDRLPLTPSQRVEKYRLREQGVTDDTYDAERVTT